MRAHRKISSQPRRRGFSLLELLIGIVVVAILASLAMPNFMGAVRKSRRSEAFNALSAVQQAQERWRANNSTYAATLTSLGLSSSTPGGLYTIAVAGTDATNYEATATAVSGTSQASDTNCAKLGVKMSNGNLTYAGSGSTLTYAATNPCWSR